MPVRPLSVLWGSSESHPEAWQSVPRHCLPTAQPTDEWHAKLPTHDRHRHAWMTHMGQIWEPEEGREGAEAFQTAGEASELGEATAGSPIFVPV